MGQSWTIPIVVQGGLPNHLRAWLTDEASQVDLTSPAGFLGTQTVNLRAALPGTWTLFASADDVYGCHQQTTANRLVKVSP